MAHKSLGRLEPVNLREYWQDEARDFTNWLAEEGNLSLLSDALGMDLELEGVEVAVGPYKADIVARDLSSDSRVVIENQLEKTNHDHLGKMLTYASGLDATIMIWIAKEFSEEHRRAFGDSSPAPQFKIVSRPNEYTSEIKTDSFNSNLTEAKALYLDLWNGFKQYCTERSTTLNIRKPRPQHWFTIAIGRSKFQISLTATQQNRRIGCEVYIRGKNAKTAFKLLEVKKEQIEKSLGELEWQELPDKQDCRIVLYKYNVEIKDRDNWQEMYGWYKEIAEKFHKTFSPIIRSLPDLGDEDENGQEA